MAVPAGAARLTPAIMLRHCLAVHVADRTPRPSALVVRPLRRHQNAALKRINLEVVHKHSSDTRLLHDTNIIVHTVSMIHKQLSPVRKYSARPLQSFLTVSLPSTTFAYMYISHRLHVSQLTKGQMHPVYLFLCRSAPPGPVYFNICTGLGGSDQYAGK